MRQPEAGPEPDKEKKNPKRKQGEGPKGEHLEGSGNLQPAKGEAEAGAYRQNH